MMLLRRFEVLAGLLRNRFGETERGATLVEYALLVALVAVVCISAAAFLGKVGAQEFNDVGSAIR